MVSTNQDVRAVVGSGLKQYPWLYLKKGKKHYQLRSERSRDFIPISFSPSDIRVAKHLRAQIRRLAEQGQGFIAAKHSR